MPDTIAKMIAGFKEFRHMYYADDVFCGGLARRQRPKVLVIACSDSRVDPAILTGCDPGDIFVIRNVANLVPPYGPDRGYHGVSAALEFAVNYLEVEHIIVLGHSNCGGIGTLLEHGDKPDNTEFLGRWLELAQPARCASVDRRSCEEEAVRLALDNLMTFPWIEERVRARRLALHGWYFDITNGRLLEYDPDLRQFMELA